MTLFELFTVVKDVATFVGVAIAAWSLLITARTNRAKFWLELRTSFAKHDDVHRALRPGGKWADSKGPTTIDEYAQIEAYMGLLEHCEIMLSQRLVDEATFREIYQYRLKNLVANKWVREEKLCRCADGWARFIALLERMQVKYKCPKPSYA